MTWEEKVEAINCIAGVSLHMRFPGNWYATSSLSVKRGSLLGSFCGNGKTPQDAIEDYWKQLTNLKDEEYLVSGLYPNRKAFKWNGFMWKEVDEKARQQHELLRDIKQLTRTMLCYPVRVSRREIGQQPIADSKDGLMIDIIFAISVFYVADFVIVLFFLVLFLLTKTQ